MSKTLATHGNPALYRRLKPATGAVMQDFAYANGYYFVTQAAKGTVEGQENVVVSCIDDATGRKEKMILLDAGHGIGIDAEIIGGKRYIYYSWGYRTHVRIPFKAGTYSFAQAAALPGFNKYAILEDGEMLVKYDWASGYMVCCHGAGSNDVFYRRKISEYRAGIDVKYNALTLSMGGDGTLQGFASIGEIFYRLLGAGANDGIMSATDPVIVEAHDWQTGKLITRKLFPHLGLDNKKQWVDGHCEPEGMTVYREKNGSGSLLIGLVVGLHPSGKRQWRVYKFTDLK